jgi:hypothetical protein
MILKGTPPVIFSSGIIVFWGTTHPSAIIDHDPMTTSKPITEPIPNHHPFLVI